MKKLILRFLILTALTLGCQPVLGTFLDGRPFIERDLLDQHLRDRVDVLFLGDSVLETVAPEDEDHRDIARMVDDRCDDLSVGLVHHAGCGMEMYLSYVQYVARQPYKPRRIIIPINLRSFSPSWSYRFDLEQSRLVWGDALGLGFHRPFAVFNLNPTPIVNPPPPLKRVAGDSWSAFYMGALDPDHPRLRALQRLIEVCRKSGVAPLIYVTPINVSEGVRFLGPEFRQRVGLNVEVCRAAAAAAGEQIVDLSLAVPDSSDFGLVEHLGERGRKRVAAELADSLRRR